MRVIGCCGMREAGEWLRLQTFHFEASISGALPLLK
jgi:hypothetical protein